MHSLLSLDFSILTIIVTPLSQQIFTECLPDTVPCYGDMKECKHASYLQGAHRIKWISKSMGMKSLGYYKGLM